MWTIGLHIVIANRHYAARCSYNVDCRYNKNVIRYNTPGVNLFSDNTLTISVAPSREFAITSDAITRIVFFAVGALQEFAITSDAITRILDY